MNKQNLRARRVLGTTKASANLLFETLERSPELLEQLRARYRQLEAARFRKPIELAPQPQPQPALVPVGGTRPIRVKGTVAEICSALAARLACRELEQASHLVKHQTELFDSGRARPIVGVLLWLGDQCPVLGPAVAAALKKIATRDQTD